jgi:hypothetical protein
MAGACTSIPHVSYAVTGAERTGVGRGRIPLQTLSIVLTWLPSSIVCKVKSISGIGFFCWRALKALSTWTRFSILGGRGLLCTSPSMMAIRGTKTKVCLFHRQARRLIEVVKAKISSLEGSLELRKMGAGGHTRSRRHALSALEEGIDRRALLEGYVE